ncbi:YihY/virulence factor BrkB family protein [Streptomyces sp. JJ66]|uniref:YihY/virulence factor BrkB family protein n=1 Tax=Streptomyces sp. JJ66 TaxID=2803843 RepID=UPI001C573131|nr:YihY/virulence factor BrkB family protein [Streptomyces sp. JJ66]MBW1601404.1 YihY/virulence factor BrkB family protein [Streptomyces sp. JJ66]
MDWLTRLPYVGPLVVKLTHTHLWRAYERMDATHWTRLSAAITFTSFMALFPGLALAAAVGAAFLTESQIGTAQDWLSAQLPGIADQVGLQSFVDNAGTVGLIAGTALLFTGLNWVESVRGCVRAVWRCPEEELNPVLVKLRDLGMLAGLGGVVVVSLAGSAFAVGAVDWTADQLGVERAGVARAVLQTVPVVAALGVDFLLLGYLLTRIPGVRPPRWVLLQAGLIGAVGFELLKLLLGGYLKGVAAKSMYGAFGVPVALLLWMNLVARLLLFCAAWAATAREVREETGEQPRACLGAESAESAEDAEDAPGSLPSEPSGDGDGDGDGHGEPGTSDAGGRRTGSQRTGPREQVARAMARVRKALGVTPAHDPPPGETQPGESQPGKTKARATQPGKTKARATQPGEAQR